MMIENINLFHQVSVIQKGRLT